MKPLVFIISIYFLFLALLPCNCNIQIMDSLHDKTEQVSTTSNDNESDSHQDMCTPFCSCASFHNPNFIAQNSFDLRNMNVISAKKIAIYNENQTSSHLNSLWRPPKA